MPASSAAHAGGDGGWASGVGGVIVRLTKKERSIDITRKLNTLQMAKKVLRKVIPAEIDTPKKF